MKRFSMTLGLALAALSLLAVPAAVHAGDRPIQGSGSGAINYNGIRLNASGDITHLGESSVQFVGDESSFWNAQLVVGQCSFWAANGDLLGAVIDTQTFDPDTGILLAAIEFRSTHSSGRFDDVVGSATLLIVFDDWWGAYEGVNPSFEFFIDGTIDY